MLKYLLLLTLLLSCNFSFSQRGKDGDVTVSIQDEWLNAYTFLTSDASNGDATITVDNNSMNSGLFSSSLEQGDLVLIIQMQGVDIDVETFGVENWGGTYTTQTSWNGFGQGGTEPDWLQNEFGQILNYNNAGFYEQREVLSVNGLNEIEFTCPLENSYTASHHVQIVRIPRIENLTILNNSSVSCPLWDGFTGGIVCLEVNGNLTMTNDAIITATGKGFRGGITNNQSAFNPDPQTQGYLGSFEPLEGGEKGESVFGHYTEYEAIYSRYCRGAIANGGGGGNYHNSGGGGGANVGSGTFTGNGVPDIGANNEYETPWNLESTDLLSNPSSGGGRGGYSHVDENNDPLTVGPSDNIWGGDFRRIAGGVGGHALSYASNRVFMGGGGGAGDMNDSQGGSGGRGGGIVMLTVYGDILGEGTIEANGEDGENAEGGTPGFNGKTGDDGAGGAGGGGSIILSSSQTLPNLIELFADGGKGGDQVLRLGAVTPAQADGPGGGGGGGLIRVSNPHSAISVAGGLGGTTNSNFMTDFPYNGATGGAEGLFFTDLPHFDLLAEDDTICGGGATTITVDIVGNLPPGSQINWYENQYDQTSIHQGNSFTTPSLTENTTYYIGVCPSTFRKPVTILVSPEIVINGPPTIVDETCAGNDGSIDGIIVTGGYGQLTYEWNGDVFPSPTISGLTGGDYEFTVRDENGCEQTAGPYTVGASPGPEINTDNISITNETCVGNDGSITGITAQGNNLTYVWNGNVTPSSDLTGAPAGSYTLEVTDQDGCTSTAGPFEITSEGGPEIDTTSIIISNETCAGNDGSITGITVQGNNITYSWNGNSTPTADLENVTAGSYTLEASDEDGCTTTVGPFEIISEGGPEIDTSNMNITNETCTGTDGAITGITVLGSNLVYEWNGTVETDIDLLGVVAGDYTLTVTDDNNCSSTLGPLTVEKEDGPEIDDTNIVIQPAECGEANGEISGIIVQGDGVSYYWNNNQSTTVDLIGLSSGSYVLDVIDVNGCEASSGPYEIPNIGGPEVDTSAMIIENASCGSSDGYISGIVVTGDNLTYAWNGQPSDSINISDLAPGDYSLIVTDDQGCQTSVGPFIVTGDPGPIVNDDSLEIVSATCNGNDGAIIGLQIQGDSLRYFWNGIEQDSVHLVNINTGDYTLEVIDQGGCAVTYGPITVLQETPYDTWVTPEYELIDAGDNVQINVGVEAPGTIVSSEWTPTGRLSCSDCSDPVANPITTTEYTVTVVTSDGCTSEHIVRIEVNAICGDLHIPDNFSPNNDGLNEELCVYGGCVAEYSLQIYNRWGELIFSSEDASECWDGTYRGKELNAAIYVYQLRAKLTDGTEIEKKGNLNLFR